jgi:hypothetical protein
VALGALPDGEQPPAPIDREGGVAAAPQRNARLDGEAGPQLDQRRALLAARHGVDAAVGAARRGGDALAQGDGRLGPPLA